MTEKELIKDFNMIKGNPCKGLLLEVRSCDKCKSEIDPKPILNFHPNSKILIAGQAPGIKVHKTGLPWNDASGERLREWMSISKKDFYNVEKFAIIPMGYCYPGTGKSGDLPPRKECADLWLEKILKKLTNVELVIAIGQYAQNHYINKPENTLTETVKSWKKYKKEKIIPLPHPSPRNNIWLKKNPWFNKELIPNLRKELKKILG